MTTELTPEETAQLTVVWSNCNPPLFPTKPGPCIMVDDSLGYQEHRDRITVTVPAVTIWDWNTVPDALSVGLIVTALDVLDIATQQDLSILNPPPRYDELLAMLGHNSFVSEDWEEAPDLSEYGDWTDAVAVIDPEF